MNVADSSAWIEYFFKRPNSAHFTPIITDLANLLVPSVAIHEVVRYGTHAASRQLALEMSTFMERGRVVVLDADVARFSARLSLKHGLSLADSIIYATAQAHNAKLYTQDSDLAKLPGVKYIRAR